MSKLKDRINEIEQKVATGEMDASQCFTQMRQLIDVAGGQSELLPLYREVVGRVAIAEDARTVLPDMRCWWGKENILRIAMDLPDKEGRAFIGRG